MKVRCIRRMMYYFSKPHYIVKDATPTEYLLTDDDGETRWWSKAAFEKID